MKSGNAYFSGLRWYMKMIKSCKNSKVRSDIQIASQYCEQRSWMLHSCGSLHFVSEVKNQTQLHHINTEHLCTRLCSDLEISRGSSQSPWLQGTRRP